MKVTSEKTIAQYPSGLKSVQKYGSLIGQKPLMLGRMSWLYKDLTISNIIGDTHAVFNPDSKMKGYKYVTNDIIRWDIEMKYIKRVKFHRTQPTLNASATTGRQRFALRFVEAYFDPNDIIITENHEQIRIHSKKAIGGGAFEYVCTAVTNSMDKGIDTSKIGSGFWCRYLTNSYGEISRKGYTKRHGNKESHQNFMHTIRHSEGQTSKFSQTEKIWIDSQKKDKDGKHVFYEMGSAEDNCIENYKISREQANIFGKSNHDVNGRCLDFDEDGQELPMGDGIMEQIKPYCQKVDVPEITTAWLNELISVMSKLSDSPNGNHYTFTVNNMFMKQFQEAMMNAANVQMVDGAAYYLHSTGGEIKLGANFASYMFMKNTVTFSENRILTEYYPDELFGICLSIGAKSRGDEPTLASFAYGSTELQSGYLEGLGGWSGNDQNGKISSEVTVSSYHLVGTASCVYYNPYQAVILSQARA